MDKYSQKVLEAAERLVSFKGRTHTPEFWALYYDVEEAVRERNLAEARKAGM